MNVAENAETVPCPFCESEIGIGARKCRHCGEWVARDCEDCGTPVRKDWAARGLCAECSKRRQAIVAAPSTYVVGERKSRGVATVCALLVGGFGVHKFYLGKPGAGVLYLFFCWTLIPALVALCEGIGYAVMSEEEFHARYSPNSLGTLPAGSTYGPR